MTSDSQVPAEPAHPTAADAAAAPHRIDARRIAAVLANEDMRVTWAQIVVGTAPDEIASQLSAPRRERVLAELRASGLVESVGTGFVATAAPFRTLLAQQPKPVVATGIDRFIRNGRIDRYPSSMGERRELLAWIVDQAVKPGEVLTESEINERLEVFIDDFAVLRRYLVDFELLHRTPSGSSYALPQELRTT